MSVIDFEILYISNPDKAGPLAFGKLYVGQPETDPVPEINQKQLSIVQSDGTVVGIDQPMILSAGGNPVYNGSTVRLDVDGNYSIKILDKNDNQKYFIDNIFEGQPVTQQELDDALSVIATQELTTATMTASTAKTYAVGDIVETAEFATGSGTSGGGVYDAVLTSSVTPNGDNIIIGVADAAISFVLRGGIETLFKQYGPTGSGSDDEAAFTQIHTDSTQGDTMRIGVGTFDLNNVNSKLQIQGNGASTVLAPSVSAQPVLQLDRHSPDWDFYAISNLTITGDSKTSDGVTYSGTDNVAGRWDFINVFFTGCTNGVIKPLGQIGNAHWRTTFRQNTVGYNAIGQAAPVMHAGNDLFYGSHWDTCDSAAYFVNDPATGGGQISFENNVFEANPGSAIVVQTLADGMPTTPLNINHCWFELNASDGGTKQIGAYVFNNKDINIADAGIVEASGCHLKDVELTNTTMVARACRFDVNATGSYDNVLDSDSAFVIHDFYGDDTRAVSLFVQNIAHVAPWDGVRIGAQKMAHRSIATENGYGFTVSEPFNSGGTYAWTGTVSKNSVNVATDGLISGACTELTMQAAETEISPASARGIITTGKWNVVTLGYKQTEGVAADLEISLWDVASNKINFGDGILNQWVTGVALIDSVNRASTGNLNIVCRGFNAQTKVRFADFQIMAFDTKQDALDYIDSREYQV